MISPKKIKINKNKHREKNMSAFSEVLWTEQIDLTEPYCAESRSFGLLVKRLHPTAHNGFDDGVNISESSVFCCKL